MNGTISVAEGGASMSNLTVEEAQQKLPELIRQLSPGAEVIITQDRQPVARLVGLSSKRQTPRPRPPVSGVPKIGAYAGRLVVPDNFDEPLEELREYME
jgi:antitoxin (DNA-binding transcriptional repressor) of toxin-antitoxin stability system